MRRWLRRPHLAWQTTFAALAIATSVALPVVLLSVGGGVSDHEIDDLENAGYEVSISAPGLHGISDAHALALRIEGLSGAGAASPILSAPIDVFPPTGGPHPTLAEGVVPGAFDATQGPSTRSLFPDPLPLGDPTDAIHYANGTYSGPATDDVLLSAPFASSLSVGVGSTVALAPTANGTAEVPFEVTGILGSASTLLGPTAAYAVVLPLSDLQVLTGFARANGTSGALLDSADTIQVALSGAASASPSAVDRLAEEIQALVPYYGVSSLQSQAQQLRQASAVLDGFYLALSSVGLTIGLIFLALVLVRRVETERRSIGIRRAIGLPAGQIARLTGRWALGLAASGVVGGVIGGWILVEGLARFGPPEVQAAVDLAVFDWSELGLLGVAILALSLVASLAATRAALRLSLPEALR